MLEERPTKLVPLEQALKELDSPEAVTDRRARAAKRAKELAGDARGRVIWQAGSIELNKALHPLQRGLGWNPSAAETRAAEVEAGHGVDKLVFEQCLIHLRAEDMRDIYADPDRMEAERIWNAYCHQVSAYAWQQGNQSDAWIARWQAMIADRAAAEQYGDPTGAIDARLLRHVGVPYPQLPQAAWDTADVLPAAERENEYARLERKYGPRTPTTTEAPKRRGRK